MNKNNSEEIEEDFASLFEQSVVEMDSMEPGQLVETTIVSISGGCVFLQMNGKSEGQIDAEELIDKDGNITVKEGDQIKAYFLSSRNGDMLFTTKISGDKAGKALFQNAYENGIPVEGTVEKEIKGGFEIKIGESRAFCPFSQIGLKRVENSQEYIGTKQTFKIIEYKESGRNILVSSRVLLEEKQKEQIEILKKTWQEKMVVKGTVKSLQNFGAFVEIEGIQALLPISEISRSRVNDINQALSVGQEIEASLLKLDWDNNRISISMKALLSDPWDNIKSKYPNGSKHKGKVARITDFGAFVTLEPGLDGLLHVSDLKGDSRDNKPSDLLTNGQSLSVQINSIDIEKRRISLKQASTIQEDETTKKYMETESETYNPFADFMNKKEKKSTKK